MYSSYLEPAMSSQSATNAISALYPDQKPDLEIQKIYFLHGPLISQPKHL